MTIGSKSLQVFALFGLLSVVLPACALAEPKQNRPNVVIFPADDQGWGDLSLHGNKDLATPHIDSLAKDGVRFDRFYVCAVCASKRAEFLTGRYHPRTGVHGVSRGAERMNLDERTIAEAFQATTRRSRVRKKTAFSCAIRTRKPSSRCR